MTSLPELEPGRLLVVFQDFDFMEACWLTGRFAWQASLPNEATNCGPGVLAHCSTWGPMDQWLVREVWWAAGDPIPSVSLGLVFL